MGQLWNFTDTKAGGEVGERIGMRKPSRTERTLVLRAQLITGAALDALNMIQSEDEREEIKSYFTRKLLYAISAVQPFNIDQEEKRFFAKLNKKKTTVE